MKTLLLATHTISRAKWLRRLPLASALAFSLMIPPMIKAEEEDLANATTTAPAEAPAKSADEVAKELNNPNNSLAKLTFKNQFRSYDGYLPWADDQSNYTMLFQPVFPFSLGTSESGAKEVLFVRPAVPLIFDQPTPGIQGGQFIWDDITGLGDISFDIAYGQTSQSGFVWAAGMLGTVPTASDSSIAGKQWRFGPEVLFAKVSEKGLIGIFPSHQWDVGGWGDGPYFSNTQCQVFANMTPGGGWVVGSQPIMSYNHQSEDWTIPINLTVSKTTHFGKTPLKLELEANYYVESPGAFGPEWMIGFNVTPVIHNFIEDWVKGKR